MGEEKYLVTIEEISDEHFTSSVFLNEVNKEDMLCLIRLFSEDYTVSVKQV